MNMNFIILQAQAVVASSNEQATQMNSSASTGISFGTQLLLIGLLVLILLWLYHTFYVKPKVITKTQTKPVPTATEGDMKKPQINTGEITDEVSAVIGLALFLYKQQISDYEKARLTIDRVSRTYSPWSSKIYGLRQHPRG
jgi:hypothetical protein